MESFIHTISDRVLFEKQLVTYFKNSDNIIYLNSNDVKETNLLAISNTDKQIKNEYQFGFISYDFKNRIEQLNSSNFDEIQFPVKHFFTPEILFKINENKVDIEYQKSIYSPDNIKKLLLEINSVQLPEFKHKEIDIYSRISKEDYLKNVDLLKKHIQLGDIYEVNFCQEFYAENVDINPLLIYFELNEKSPTPFSCFVKSKDKYLMCASPERFLYKKEGKIISQPIKGTIKRGKTDIEDETLKQQLLNDPKEQSENVMIVDLVRNDLSKIAQRATVEVDELFGIYTFPQVHQMISTVSAQLKDNVDFDEIINATFPMGSMTGAPKIRAMELIEEFEATKRGIYSGTVGYVDKNGDFDFNVVIRSITYNQKNKYLSFIVGGAITANSLAEKEYEECLLKAKAMVEVLSGK